MPINRRFWGLTVRAYILAGLLVSCYSFVLTGCVSSDVSFPAYQTVSDPASADEARTVVRARRVAEYREAWDDADLVPFTRAIVAFRLAQETEDPVWSKESRERFDAMLEEDPFNATARVYLGASHALAARDFPIQGALQVLPGPGFIRLYHVKEAFKYIDQAVEQAPLDPQVRLVRAATSVGLTTFGGDEQGLEDFGLLMDWMADRQPNPDFRDIITSKIFQAEVWLAYASALERVGRDQEAATVWERIVQTNQDKDIQTWAKWKLQAAR